MIFVKFEAVTKQKHLLWKVKITDTLKGKGIACLLTKEFISLRLRNILEKTFIVLVVNSPEPILLRLVLLKTSTALQLICCLITSKICKLDLDASSIGQHIPVKALTKSFIIPKEMFSDIISMTILSVE